MTSEEARATAEFILTQERRELTHARAEHQDFIDFQKIAVLMCPQLKIYTKKFKEKSNG